MLRIAALALMLSPGIAHAQKFVSVDGSTDTPIVSPELSNSDPVTTDPVAPGANVEDVATIDYSLLGDSIVYDGATVEEIQALLDGADASALSADEQNAIVARIETDDAGGSVLTLDIAGSDAGGSQGATTSDVAELELGECNDGTDWVTDQINCYNAQPTADQ